MFLRTIEAAKTLLGAERVNRHYYELVYGSGCWDEVSTFNYGFSPVSPEVAAAPRAAGQAFQIQLYDEVAKAAGDPAQWLTGKRLLEISCGRGGGLAFLSDRHAPAVAIGLDRSFNAARFATRRSGVAAVNAVVQAAPFADASFDAVISVEALHHYHNGCIRELRRLLRPSGLCIVADSRPGDVADVRALMEGWWARLGMVPLSFRDITANVAESCRLDAQRRERLIRRAPLAVRPVVRQLVGIGGGDRHRDFVTGQRCYFITVARKP